MGLITRPGRDRRSLCSFSSFSCRFLASWDRSSISTPCPVKASPLSTGDTSTGLRDTKDSGTRSSDSETGFREPALNPDGEASRGSGLTSALRKSEFSMAVTAAADTSAIFPKSFLTGRSGRGSPAGDETDAGADSGATAGFAAFSAKPSQNPVTGFFLESSSPKRETVRDLFFWELRPVSNIPDTGSKGRLLFCLGTLGIMASICPEMPLSGSMVPMSTWGAASPGFTTSGASGMSICTLFTGLFIGVTTEPSSGSCF